MEAILKFDLNNPDDKIAHYRCVKALDLALILWQIRVNLRRDVYNKVESEEAKHPGFDYITGVELTLKHIDQLFEAYGVNVDELVV